MLSISSQPYVRTQVSSKPQVPWNTQPLVTFGRRDFPSTAPTRVKAHERAQLRIKTEGITRAGYLFNGNSWLIVYDTDEDDVFSRRANSGNFTLVQETDLTPPVVFSPWDAIGANWGKTAQETGNPYMDGYSDRQGFYVANTQRKDNDSGQWTRERVDLLVEVKRQ